MKNYKLLLLLFTVQLLTISCNDKSKDQTKEKETVKNFKIAFGSCGWERHELPIFYEVVKHKPNLFVFLGDNIYADTKDMEVMKKKYQMLADKPSYQHLKKNVPIVATWDDHDYGWNDIGRHYPFKKESKEIFLEFFEEPKDSERRQRDGIYTSYFYDVEDKKVQVILLDERTFRDDIPKYNDERKGDRRYFYGLDYGISQSKDSTMLGVEQWKWLEKEFEKTADVRVIGSATQFGIEYNGYEAWANFPHEQQKMIDLIAKTKANGVIFISGDVHYAEISKLTPSNTYPIYDVTSSGLSSTWHFATPNKNRIEGPIMENHFGMLTIEFGEKPNIKAEVFDITGNQRVEYTIPISELNFNKTHK